jgi:hypothetical protein
MKIHPTCGNCQRHNAAYLYNHDGAKLQIENPKPNRARSDAGVSDASLDISSVDPNVPNSSESRSRRLAELKLLHHYNARTSQTLLVSRDPTAAHAWTLMAPNPAVGNEALLYSIFSLSTRHMADIDPQHSYEIMDTHRRYLDLALRRTVTILRISTRPLMQHAPRQVSYA